MNNEEILKKAIEKAEKNGYDFWNNNYCPKCDRFIFTKDFAKAFWKEQKGNRMYKGWELGLQQMVLEESPIKYLEEFI